MKPISFLAFDLGATSGRSVVGTLSSGSDVSSGDNAGCKGSRANSNVRDVNAAPKLELRELTRFPNSIQNIEGRYYWDIFLLFEQLKEGLRECVRQGIEVASIGIDTWGVDFVLIGGDGQLLGQPRAYRDPYTEHAPQEYFDNVMPREEVYRRTGIQIMNFNSLFQLYAQKQERSPLLEVAERALFMPDALGYMLTGSMVTEYTIASTSQILNPHTKQMEREMLELAGIRGDLFGDEVVMPGYRLGTLTDDICRETGMKPVPVVAVAGHDTASAVAAVPAVDGNFAYLSSGTWSLMGIEVREPVITEETFALNFTNEGGVEGTTRLLKNITGMWIVEQCLKEWKAAGDDYSYPQMVAMAEKAEPFAAFIDPDDPSFAAPENMLGVIVEYCARTGQQMPQSHGGIVRMILESLALKYRYVFEKFRALAPFPLETLHIIGGGARNALLNGFTANSLGVKVVAGPSEATAIGNVMLQARAAGMVGSLEEMRRTIAAAIKTEMFLPHDTQKWDSAYNDFKNLAKNKT